jgi:NitT/TauT family transport system substrate-binding protein
MKNLFKRTWTVFLFLALFAACSKSEKSTAPVSASLKEAPVELVTIRLANLAPGAASVPQNAGLKHGIYEKHGIDLKVVNFLRGGPEAAAGTASGQVDMGSFGTPILTAISKGIPIKIVSSPPDKHIAFELVARAEIKKVEDLRGKTVASGALGGGNHQSLLKILAAHGLTDQDLKIVATGGADASMILASGQVDAVQTSTIDRVRMEAEGFGHLLAESKNYYKDYQHSYIFATEAFIAAHPQAITNFLKAHREVMQYALDNTDEIVEAAKEMVNLNEDIIRTYYANLFANWDLSFDIDKLGVANAVAILKELDEIESSVVFDEASWIDDRFLKESQK